jgi:uncharacterized protein YkwD
MMDARFTGGRLVAAAPRSQVPVLAFARAAASPGPPGARKILEGVAPARLNRIGSRVDTGSVRRLVVLLATALLAVALPAARPAAAASADPAAAEQEFVVRINALRSAKGLGPLAVDGELTTLARRWAASMAAADRISHNPALSTQVQADWQKLGENVGVGMTVGELHDAFVASPAHYRNLVDRDFTFIGVGVVVGRGGALFTAHEFMQLRHSAAPPPAATEATPAAPTARIVLVLQQLRALDGR